MIPKDFLKYVTKLQYKLYEHLQSLVFLSLTVFSKGKQAVKCFYKIFLTAHFYKILKNCLVAIQLYKEFRARRKYLSA